MIARSFLATFATTLAVLTLAACAADNETHPAHAEYDAGEATPLSCVPNLDGVIDATEVKAVFGVPVKYLVSAPGTTPTVDVAGSVDSAGQLVWSYGTDLASDEQITVSATALGSQWYASSFPSGQYVAPFDAAQTLDAIYAQTDSELDLLGVASHEAMPAAGQTLLVYTPAVPILEFPLQPGTSWTAVGMVMNGTVQGLPYIGQDTYEITDDATGELVLPEVTFTQAHRVRTKLTQAPSAGATTVTQQVSFFFECFGEVARATSQPNETNANFTTASEVRRYGP